VVLYGESLTGPGSHLHARHTQRGARRVRPSLACFFREIPFCVIRREKVNTTFLPPSGRRKKTLSLQLCPIDRERHSEKYEASGGNCSCFQFHSKRTQSRHRRRGNPITDETDAEPDKARRPDNSDPRLPPSRTEKNQHWTFLLLFSLRSPSGLPLCVLD